MLVQRQTMVVANQASSWVGTSEFKSGWNAKQVQMLLGHHSPASTLATYVHLLPDDLPEPDFLDEALGGTDEAFAVAQPPEAEAATTDG